MTHRITHVSVHRTALTVAVLYAVVTVVVVPFLWLADRASPEGPALAPVFYLAVPLLYGLFVYLSTALISWLYNRIAPHVGGIEVTLSSAPPSVG